LQSSAQKEKNSWAAVAELDELGRLLGAPWRKCHWEMTIVLSAKFAEGSDGLSNLRHVL
jgi:hypothetical protein